MKGIVLLIVLYVLLCCIGSCDRGGAQPLGSGMWRESKPSEKGGKE